ncbi:hypothetical protein ABH905_003952 [Pseudomonas frederiksbergensis]|uniref:hypothetical protein n=1 Tax=Pseudomonas frederiksbergensis TaxID=104087 RepID=UPI003D244F15
MLRGRGLLREASAIAGCSSSPCTQFFPASRAWAVMAFIPLWAAFLQSFLGPRGLAAVGDRWACR